MPNETAAKRIPATVGSKLFGPLVIAAGIAWIVHLALPKTGTMFDDDNIGPTAVFGLVALLIIIAGIFMTRASIRSVDMEGPCPGCGTSTVRRFDRPQDPASDPTPCGTCIAYLRAGETALREEAIEAFRRSYDLDATQYVPALQRLTNRAGYKFEIPTMCAVCGDPTAPHKRKIEDGQLLVTDPIELFTKHNIVPMVGMAPSSHAPTEDEKNDKGLSHLVVPVCDKHTEKADPFGQPLEYENGGLQFRSYRYYKAFCELNNITRAPIKKKS